MFDANEILFLLQHTAVIEVYDSREHLIGSQILIIFHRIKKKTKNISKSRYSIVSGSIRLTDKFKRLWNTGFDFRVYWSWSEASWYFQGCYLWLKEYELLWYENGPLMEAISNVRAKRGKKDKEACKLRVFLGHQRRKGRLSSFVNWASVFLMWSKMTRLRVFSRKI